MNNNLPFFFVVHNAFVFADSITSISVTTQN